MFSLNIVDSDAFLDLPPSAQALYFHLGMRCDDDGFVNSPKKIQRIIGATDDDLKILIDKKFILSFESGIVAMKHHRINNYIQKDRYTETSYLEEKEKIFIKTNKAYTLNSSHSGIVPLIEKSKCIHSVSKMETQSSLGKVRLGKDSLSSVPSRAENDETHLLGELKNVSLTEKQYKQLQDRYERVGELIDNVSLWLPDHPRSNHYAVCLTFAKNGNWPKKKKPKVPEQKPDPEDNPMTEEEKAAAVEALKKKLGGGFNADNNT